MGSARASILRWDSDGDFVGTIGAPGDGPGEFTTQYRLNVYLGPNESLYVNEHRRWSVFDSDLDFVRIINSPEIGRDADALIVANDGGFVYAGPILEGDSTKWFHRFDSTGSLRASFAPVSEASIPEQRVPSRAITGAGDDAFWAAPPDGAPYGYMLEQWTTDGELVKILRRDPHWMHDRMMPLAGMNALPILPHFLHLHVDDAGLLWVVVAVMKPNAEPIEGSEPFSEEEQLRRLEIWVDVLDVETGRVLASALLPDVLDFGDGEMPPLVPVPPGRETIRVVADELGFDHLEVFRWYLVPN